jgi:type IV pilus assembly protein PilQ
MKAFGRFALLGSCTAIGAGLAFYVAVSTDPGAVVDKKPPGQLAAVARMADDPQHKPAGQGTAAVRAAPAESSCENRDSPRRERESATVEFSGPQLQPISVPEPAPPSPAAAQPVLVLPSPPVAARFEAPPAVGLAQADKAKMDSALDYLMQRMAAEGAARAPVPAPAPAQPAPPGASAEALPAAAPREPAARAAKPPKPIVKIDPEGSGKLNIHIPNVELREVLDLLGEQGGLNILAGKEVQGKVTATLTGVDIQSALDAILKSTGYASRRQGKFIFVDTPDAFNSMEQAMDRIETRVYRPNYVTAAELKALVQPLLTEKVGTASVSSPAEAGIAASDATAGGDKFAGGDVVLVRDYEAVLAQIDQVVAEIDVRPLQVAIEAMILSVKLDDTDKFGVNFQLLQNHVKFGWGTPPQLISDIKLDGGMKFGYLDGDVSVFLEALEKIADTNVIATPRLTVLNKHRAEILIGEKQGYVSTTVTETAATQAVDFLETGTQLRLRPFISRDGTIRMEVHPELSDGSVNVTGNFTLPNKTVTEVTTNIMVRDGCTVVIGGLIKEQLTAATTAVPVLGSMPWIGPLFRNKTETTGRQEVIVLITPRIMYEPSSCQEGDKAACEFQRRQAVYAEKMSPLGKRSIARRYFRLAQAAWAKGDRQTALRLAEMAVHFDPESRAAIDLRADIWQGNSRGDHTLQPVASAGPELLDGEHIADWMLEDLKQDAPAAPLHPLDPGQPGSHTNIVRPRRLP